MFVKLLYIPRQSHPIRMSVCLSVTVRPSLSNRRRRVQTDTAGYTAVKNIIMPRLKVYLV